MRPSVSLSHSLNTALLRAALVALILLAGISFVAYKGAIEQQIYRDSHLTSDLVFERFYNLMARGAASEEIRAQLDLLQDETQAIRYDVLRSDLVARQYGGKVDLIQAQLERLEKRDFFQQQGLTLTYYRPILFDQRCQMCHDGVESGQLAGALAISSPVLSLKLPFRYLVWGVLLIVILTLVSTLMILSHHARRNIIQPVERLSEKMRQIDDHTDLVEAPRKNWRIREIDLLETAFHSQHQKLLNAYEDLKQQAELDTLTGAYNRFRFDDLLEKALARAERQSEPLSLVMVDLDRFKEINDSLGHDVGDMALKRLARQLQKVLRSSDYLIRLGGDEFLVVAERCTREQTASVFERLVEALQEAEVSNPIGCNIEFSTGVAEYPQDAQTRQALIKIADERMYRQKVSRRQQRQSSGGA
ncbi:diguanylate cyclase [Marinobacterium sp. AK62]|uniref:Diguanylate cyclase n=1 Tax=Marinobacterium alkalitolerans TaxID=1542925 RepID=A0ABS3ZDU7_9GAMM|nr:diguanylate cyclase [Marinobacterium alkalitolerans]MBP0049854.1 diguanylate cyclase [Marinobacterium alkalitolerans]